MKETTWRKSEKKDAFSFVLVSYVFSIIFFIISKYTYDIWNIYGIVFFVIAIYSLLRGSFVLFKNIILNLPYEVYIRKKIFSVHVKGSKINLPNTFSELTDEHNKYLDNKKLPPKDLLYDTKTELSEKIDDIKSGFTSKSPLIKVIINITLLIFALVFSLKNLIQSFVFYSEYDRGFSFILIAIGLVIVIVSVKSIKDNLNNYKKNLLDDKNIEEEFYDEHTSN